MMKRILLLVLVLSLLIAGSAAQSDALDLTALSNEEIVLLLASVQEELAARRIEKTATLQTGVYVGGREVPPGGYVLTAAGTEGQFGIVSLRSVADGDNDWPSKLYEFVRGENEFTAYVTIEKGDTLELPFPFTLTISAGVQFK